LDRRQNCIDDQTTCKQHMHAQFAWKTGRKLNTTAGRLYWTLPFLTTATRTTAKTHRNLTV
jgi:hypothetical protein